MFKEASGEAPASQIKAFGDTWQYNQEAVAAGLYKSELRGISYPHLQIRTVEELLAGKSFEYPQRETAT